MLPKEGCPDYDIKLIPACKRKWQAKWQAKSLL